jgi:hypothetical protein
MLAFASSWIMSLARADGLVEHGCVELVSVVLYSENTMLIVHRIIGKTLPWYAKAFRNINEEETRE